MLETTEFKRKKKKKKASFPAPDRGSWELVQKPPPLRLEWATGGVASVGPQDPQAEPSGKSGKFHFHVFLTRTPSFNSLLQGYKHLLTSECLLLRCIRVLK